MTLALPRVESLDTDQVAAITRSVTTQLRRMAEAFEDMNVSLCELTTPSPQITYAEAVDAGVAFLDERLGREFWLPRINESTLDVMSQLNCVVCQVTGLTYAEGVGMLGGPGFDKTEDRQLWSVERGFALGGFTLAFNPRAYHELTTTWIRKVHELRGKGDSVYTAARVVEPVPAGAAA